MSGFTGVYNATNPPLIGLEGGFRTPFAVSAYPAARVAAYVGPSSNDLPPDVQNLLVPTLAAALPKVRASQGDMIIVLPGHTENVTDATMFDSLKAGTRIVGAADPLSSYAPTFTWTAAGSRWDIDVADVSLEGLRLHCDGANGVTNAIDVTGAGFKMEGCFWRWASGAALKAAIACTLTAATNARFLRNVVMGTPTHNVTNGILVNGASSELLIAGNRMMASATAGNGLINVAGAALRIAIVNNLLANQHTSSTSAITLGAAASSGIIEGNTIAIENSAGTVTGEGILVGSTSLVRLGANNFVSDAARLRAVATGTAAT